MPRSPGIFLLSRLAMLNDFQALQVATEFYQGCKSIRVMPDHLRLQLVRASASIALNLAEGSGKMTTKEQRKFYTIALGSIRECEAIFKLEPSSPSPELRTLLQRLGAMTFRLVNPNPNVQR